MHGLGTIVNVIAVIVFSATLGFGVLFAALPLLVYQGSITTLAGLLRALLTDTVVMKMSLVGSVLILAIGFNMLEVKKFKVGNMLPAIFIPLLYSFLYGLIEPVLKLF